MKHASSHLVADDFQPRDGTQQLLHAIVIELRQMNAGRADSSASAKPSAAPRRDDAPKPRRKTPVKRKAPVKRLPSARATAASNLAATFSAEASTKK